jgi:hypothetical protein
MDCFATLAMTTVLIAHTSTFSRRDAPELCQQLPSTERAQGMPGARCTRSLACENKKAHEVVTTSSPEQPGIPRAMVLTAYFEISPVIGFIVTVASGYGWSAPGRADFASAKLDAGIEASGPHDFTVRSNIVRLRPSSLTGWTPPCDHVCAPTLPRPPHPAPRS